MTQFGKVFYKTTYKTVFDDACSKCGKLRKKGRDDWSYDSEQYCSGCGKCFSHSEKHVVKVYVIGIYEMFNGEKGYQLSETSPDEYMNNITNGKGVSYWNYRIKQLGEEFFLTEEEALA